MHPPLPEKPKPQTVEKYLNLIEMQKLEKQHQEAQKMKVISDNAQMYEQRIKQLLNLINDKDQAITDLRNQVAELQESSGYRQKMEKL